MSAIDSVSFPAIALTPIGVMPYSRAENLRRVMKNEYKKKWFDELLVIGIDGTCAVIKSAEIVAQPFLANWFGGMVEARLTKSEHVVPNLDDLRESVLQHLSIHPEMYVSAGVYNSIVHDVAHANSIKELVEVFTKAAR